MPVHDWTRVDAGLFHHFHQRWISSLSDALNGGVLASDYFAMVEQNIRGPVPDILTLKKRAGDIDQADADSSGTAVLTAPPRLRLTKKNQAGQDDALSYLTKTNRVTVRHRHGKPIAVIEIVSPGNKSSKKTFRQFVEKSAALIYDGIHLLIIDLFPPGPRDPLGIAKAIWDEITVQDFEQFSNKPITLASFDAGPEQALHMEPIAVGDILPAMPLFLMPESYVYTPLEATYEETWRLFPEPMKKMLT